MPARSIDDLNHEEAEDLSRLLRASGCAAQISDDMWIGEGEQGTVYQVHDDWVLKITVADEADIAEAVRSDRLAPLSGIPVIAWSARVSSSVGAVLMEHVGLLDELDHQYIQNCLAGPFCGPDAVPLNDEDLRDVYFAESPEPRTSWHLSVRRRLARLLRRVGDRELTDLHADNLGVRADEYVFIDLGSLAEVGSGAPRVAIVEAEAADAVKEAHKHVEKLSHTP